MRFKLITAFVDDRKTEAVADAAGQAGATGITVVSSARGEGVVPGKTFLGLSLEEQRDVLLLVVEEHMARDILETIANVGDFDSKPGTGIAFQLDVEDAVGVSQQVLKLHEVVEEEL